MKIIDMSFEGNGIGKDNNKIVFVPKTVTGDDINYQTITEYKSYNIGKLESINKKSNLRIEAKCPYYEMCGGCNISNLSYSNQLIFKKNKIKELFHKQLKLEIEPNIIPSKEEYEYRNKITLSVDKTLGLLKSNSHDIVHISSCYLVNDKVNKLIEVLNSLNINNLTEVIIRVSDNGVMLILNGNIKLSEIEKLKDYVISIYLNNKEIYKKEDSYISLKEIKYKISANSFFQINTNNIVSLYEEIVKYGCFTLKDNVLDLYCGTGSISLYISSHCNSVLGIEINKDAIEDANINAKINNINNVDFICGDVSKVLKMGKYDVVIVDPPRSGLDKHTKKVLKEINVKRIVYVSCNPITMVRDIKDMSERYNFENITLVDMFPQTHHVETVVLLSHKKPDGHINVKVEFGEGEGKVPLDNIAKRAEEYKPKERVTYKMIKEYIEAKYGFKVHTAYIAEVKRDLGLPMYDAPNAVEELKQPRKHPTAEKVEAIRDALKHFEVI